MSTPSFGFSFQIVKEFEVVEVDLTIDDVLHNLVTLVGLSPNKG